VRAAIGYWYHHVQSIMLAIGQYAETALGDPECFFNKPSGGRCLAVSSCRDASRMGPDVSATPATSLAGKSRLPTGKPDVIGPVIAADRSPMAAMVVRAID
jgi:hypothetical protein